jgi:hypothetical protein
MAIAILVVSTQAASSLRTGKLRDPFRWDVEQNADADALLRWFLSQESNRPVRLLSGPGWTLPFWRYGERMAPQDIPSNMEDWDQLTAFLSDNGLSWAAIDADMVERRPDLLGDYFSFTGEDLVLHQSPPGWTAAREVHGANYDWYVFRTSQE